MNWPFVQSFWLRGLEAKAICDGSRPKLAVNQITVRAASGHGDVCGSNPGTRSRIVVPIGIDAEIDCDRQLFLVVRAADTQREHVAVQDALAALPNDQ